MERKDAAEAFNSIADYLENIIIEIRTLQGLMCDGPDDMDDIVDKVRDSVQDYFNELEEQIKTTSQAVDVIKEEMNFPIEVEGFTDLEQTVDEHERNINELQEDVTLLKRAIGEMPANDS